MRRGRRSLTSDLVAALRALYSQAPPELASFDDPAALELLPTGLAVLVRALGATPGIARLSHRVLGAGTRGVTYNVALRTAAIDDVVRHACGEGVRQVVVLGAGLDARAWRLPELEDAVVFEVDHADTQAYKRDQVSSLAPLAKDVVFVPVDFERQTLHVLETRGFSRSERSVWVWEGVTMYLDEAAISGTLAAVEELSAPGSVLSVTYLTPDYAALPIRSIARVLARGVGEPVKSSLSPHDLAALVDRYGFDVESDESAVDWAARYWPQADALRARAWERLLVACRRVSAR